METRKAKELRGKCLSHARDLLDGAKALFRRRFYNIAYHLAALALEEIGKSFMIVRSFSSSKENQAVKMLKQSREDHAKKLFWALWIPTLGSERISKEQIQSFIDLSGRIHATRIAGLYVDPFQEQVVEPRKSVLREDADKLIGLAESRIKLEEFVTIEEPDEQTREDFFWLENTFDHPETKNIILAKSSIEKLVEFKGDGKKWVRWIREQVEQADQENRRLVQQELDKPEPPDIQKLEKKWEVTFRLLTPSHSVRQKPLNYWNSKIHFLTLRVGRKGSRSSELIVDMTLPKAVSIRGLWHAAWGEARALAVSLNIATRGLFWWYLPRDISKFYDTVKDLENDAMVEMERTPRLAIKWPRRVLSENDLARTSLCYRFVPRQNLEFLNHYVTGISLLGKNDIHTPFEQEIFLQFYHALILALQFYGRYEKRASWASTAETAFRNIMPKSALPKEYVLTAEDLKKSKNTGRKVSLTECVGMKLLFDTYVLDKLVQRAEKERASPNKGKAPTHGHKA